MEDRAPRISNLVVSLMVAAFTAQVAPAEAQQCSDVLSTIIAEAVRPLLEKAPLCRGLRQEVNVGFGKIRLAIDKTSEVRLRSFQYCPGERDSRLKANVFVRCESSSDSVVHLSASATFQLDMTVDNQTCTITAFKIEPESRDEIVREIVRFLTANFDLTNKVRTEAARHISVVCRPNG